MQLLTIIRSDTELIGNMGGMKYKVYDIPPKTWNKGPNNVVVLDVSYEKVKSIDAVLYNATRFYALPHPALIHDGAYDISFAISVQLSNDGVLRIYCGGEWSGYGLHVVVGYVD